MAYPHRRKGVSLAEALRRPATDPIVPAAVLSAGALLAGFQGYPLTWAILGGLAGYTLSGSV